MKRPLALGALALLLPALASAQAVQNIVLRNSFNPAGAGARGLGMGGAFIGVADDGTAASFNPAGLAQLRHSELALVGFTDLTETTRTDLSSNRTLTDSIRHSKPEFFSLAVPFEVGGRSMTVQFSYQRAIDLFGKGAATTHDNLPLRDLGINLPGTAELRGDIVPEQAGAFNTASASAAYQATRRLSFGLALNYWFAHWTADGRASFRVSTVPSAPGASSVLLRSDVRQFNQKQKLTGMSLNLGLLLKYSWLSAGAVVRLPFTGDYELEETGSLTTTEIGRQAVTSPVAVEMATSLHVPVSAGFGLALRPFGGMTLAADYSRADWTRTVLDNVVDGALLTPAPPTLNGVAQEAAYTDRNFFDLAPAAVTSTEDTSAKRAGAEYLITVPKLVIPLRAGIFREESPVPDLSRNKARSVSGWTLGSGLNFSRVVLDVAFERRTSEGVVGIVFRRGQNAAASTTESVSEDRVVGSLIYRFGGTDDPLKRIFRSLFGGGEEKGEN